MENLGIDQALDEFRKLLSDYELDEFFLRLVLLKVKRTQQPQIRMYFLDLVMEEHENEIQLVHSQIQSFDFHDPKEFLQNLPSPSHEEIVLPCDLQIEDNLAFKIKVEVLVAGFVTEDVAVPLDQEGPKETIPHNVFMDPVADYMEDLHQNL